MQWKTGLAILVFILLSFLLWERSMKNQLINQLQTQSLTREVDTLTKETEVKVIEWKEKKVFADKIVNKWHNVHDTIIKRDTLLIECRKDIFSLDTALYSCELALGSCLSLNNAQSKLVKNLENRKSPLIVPVIGVGLSMNRDLIVQPSVNATIGINLNKIFGKK
jgi:hypothetical protein